MARHIVTQVSHCVGPVQRVFAIAVAQIDEPVIACIQRKC